MYRHRFLGARHVHDLHFADSSMRACQVRLQRMWAARLLDRHFLPAERPGQRDRWYGVPLYCLAPGGAAVIAEDLGLEYGTIPHTPAQNRRGFCRMRHNLAATDALVAVEALYNRAGSTIATSVHEWTMAGALTRARQMRSVPHALIPDGAVTVAVPGVPTPQTYVVEVVRATVKAGNDTIRRRLHRYRAALRTGLFRDVFAFAWVRSVLFLTPTTRRAENLARLGRDVPGADRLFRFAAYEQARGPDRAPEPMLTAERVTSPMFLTASGQRVTLLPPLTQ